MSPVIESDVMKALENVMDPELNHNVVKLGFIQDVEIDDDFVHLDIQLTSPHCPRADEIVGNIRNAVLSLDGVNEVEVERACEKEA
ncbi:MAG: iron-sulfur cluster assembly protein [Acidiferrobacterales bacterium]|jgi:metal-sulfur cluster biosynthetic enzyme|nr:iron-sulfur cluster assembly protein [Acidiferrobacterales bacterium]